MKLYKSPTLDENLKKLETISKLESGWNCYCADPIPTFMIDIMKDMLSKLKIQPEIFPLECGSIQFEYEKDNGDYLEFKILHGGLLEMYVIIGCDDSNKIIEVDSDKINEIVDNFMG